MSKIKKLAVILLVVALTGLSVATVLSYSGRKTIDVTYRNIKIVVNGKRVYPDQEPFIYKGRTFVPIRFVSEGLGQKVGWDNSTSTVYIGESGQNGGNNNSDRDTFYSIWGNWRWSYQSHFSNLQAIVMKKGYKYIAYEGSRGNNVQPNAKAVIAFEPDEQQLGSLYTMVKNGANVCILVSYPTAESSTVNSKLSELFGVAVIRGSASASPSSIKGKDYCSIFDGLIMNGIGTIMCNLAITKNGPVPYGKMKYSDGKFYTTSAMERIGNGKCLIIVIPNNQNYWQYPFCADDFINSAENYKATELLVQWLSN